MEIYISEIEDFIHRSILDIESDFGYSKTDIIVCLPRYVYEFYKRKMVLLNRKDTFYMFGKEVQYSFNNSVIVFYNHFNPKKIIKYTKEL